MKKFLIIAIALILAGCGSGTPKDPKVELLEFRQAVQKIHIPFDVSFSEMMTFIEINGNDASFDPIAVKIYGDNIRNSLKSTVEDIKKLPYSKAISGVRDAAIDREIKKVNLINKVLSVMPKGADVKQDALEPDGGLYNEANKKYEQEIAKIDGEYKPLPELQRAMHISNCKTISSRFGSKTIEGIIKNNTGKNISYAQVLFTLYDKDGNQIGSAVDNINNLEKDATWKFSANALGTESFYYAKLVKIDYH